MNKILLVDDDPLDRLLANRTFSEMDLGCEIVDLADGQELLTYFEQEDMSGVSLVLLDLKMPRMSGLEVLRRLNDESPRMLRRVPFIVMSGSTIPTDVMSSYELGARAFLTKPINHADFKEAIRGIGLFWCKYAIAHPEE